MRTKPWFVGLIVVAACKEAEARRLPAATGEYREVDMTLVFELPDSGGYLVNGVPIAASEIPRQVAAVLSTRQPERRAVFVWHNARRQWKDVLHIQRSAREAGGEAFDAELSGWPRQVQGPIP